MAVPVVCVESYRSDTEAHRMIRAAIMANKDKSLANHVSEFNARRLLSL